MVASEQNKHVVIIGAGLGGIAQAIALMDNLGWKDFTIYEKSHEVGGTWSENTYPGCACDVASQWYSLSTDPNPSWSHTYASQPEILQYIKSVVNKRGIDKHIVLNSRVIDAVWDNVHEQYSIVVEHYDPNAEPGTSTPRVEHVTAGILISAIGGLHVPNIPKDLVNPPKGKGLEAYTKGVWFHAAKWNHNVDLKGKRVAVIGTGCCAVQVVPAISQDPSVQVVNFCRTPSWFVPRVNPAVSAWWTWILAHIPFVMFFARFFVYFWSDINYPIWKSKNTYFRNLITKSSEAYIRMKAPKHLVEKLVPKIEWGCKRVIRDPGYLDSLHQPNVQIEWDAVGQFVEDGIITVNGTKHELDVVVLATGFDVAPCAPVTGLDGTLKEFNKLNGGGTAYRGTTVPNFPNFFQILGPNVASGHGSAIYVEEVQANYVAKVIKPILVDGTVATVMVKPEACDAYNDEVQDKLRNTVWNGCVSYYNQNTRGAKNVAMYPGSLFSFWRMLAFPIWSDYETTPPAPTNSHRD